MGHGQQLHESAFTPVYAVNASTILDESNDVVNGATELIDVTKSFTNADDEECLVKFLEYQSDELIECWWLRSYAADSSRR